MDDDKNILMKEYANKYRKFIYRPLAYTGFCRFDISNDRIVQLSYKTMIYNMLVLLTVDCAVWYLLYSAVSQRNYLNIPDGLCVAHFALFANGIILNITFLNRRSGLHLVEHCIKLDSYLGIKETAFMRDIAIKTYVAVHCLIHVINFIVGVFLFIVYKVSIPIHIVGTLYFIWLFFSYDDYAFSLMHFVVVSLRIRYLNVALMKIGEMNENYVPTRSLFNLLLWSKNNNNMVTFHHKAGVEEFNRAYRMCFKILELLERFYAFTFLYGIWTVVVGSFVSVQTFIMRVKSPGALDNEHTLIIVGWALVSWAFILLITMITDTIPHQLQQTKLVCSYIQMKPNKPAKIYKLTKSVLATIRTRRHVANLYNLTDLGTAFSLRIAASTLVYITVQLQLAFPRIPLSNIKLNETNV